MERTIGTIFGGLLGLATVLLGHGFGQDEDIAITGTLLDSVAVGGFCLWQCKFAVLRARVFE